MSELASKSQDYFVIAETSKLEVGGLWEQVYLLDKSNNKECFLGEFDGVTDIGVIDPNNKWAVVANDKIVVWKNGNLTTIEKDEMKNVEKIELIGDNLVLLTVDTLNLNNNKSTWQLDVNALMLIRRD